MVSEHQAVVELRYFDKQVHLSDQYVKWIGAAAKRSGEDIVFFDQFEVTRDSLDAWVTNTQGEPDSLLFAVLIRGRHVGNIRIHRVVEDPAALYIGILIDPAMQGRGIARQAILKLSAAVVRSGWAEFVRARIYTSNIPSVRAFVRAGFVEVSRGTWTQVNPPRDFVVLQFGHDATMSADVVRLA
jgi:RimJ/RimL family protein N-acetyltransferase